MVADCRHRGDCRTSRRRSARRSATSTRTRCEAIVDDLEDLDLETDEVRDAVDSLVDFANEVIDADTWTEELDTSAQASITPLTEACAAAIAEVPTSTDVIESPRSR